MRRFEFPLQTALDLRAREEEAAQCRLGDARRAADDIRAELRQTRDSRDEIIAALRTGSSEGAGRNLTLAQIEHGHRYIAGLREAIESLRQRLAAAQAVCEQRRAELVQASRARRTLERLRERQQAQHRRQEMAREQRQLDEVAVTRHYRDTDTRENVQGTEISDAPRRGGYEGGPELRGVTSRRSG